VNKENMRLFVAALLSGEYEQGRYRLTSLEEDVARHCCLGVACEVALKHGVQMQVESDGYKRTYDRDTLFLPVAVQQWLGVDGANLTVLGHSASNLNDNLLWTFEQIADGIVQTYELEGEPE